MSSATGITLLLKGFNTRTSAHAVWDWSCREVNLVLVPDILSLTRDLGKYFGCVHVSALCMETEL